MIYIYYSNNDFCKQIKYIFSVVFNIFRINAKYMENLQQAKDENILLINYSNEVLPRKNVINIKPSYLFSQHYLKMESMPKVPLKKYNGFPVIYLSNEDNKNCYLNKYNNYLITNMDIIQSSFFMITRYEEILLWDKVEKDLYGRFPAKESLAYKEDFLYIPIVNEYIEWLWQWIDSFNLGYKRKSIWGKYDFAACLTHDVDRPFKYRYPLKNDIKNLKVKRTKLAYKDIFLHALSKIDYKKDSFYTFDYMRRIERKYNFTSSFYFMSGGNSQLDGKYNIEDFKIKLLIDYLIEDGCEVGYHYSFNTNENLEQMLIENNIIKQISSKSIYGGRSHYLKFNIINICNNCEKVGLLYDSTLGYGEQIGFRCGICFPYKIFDIIKNKTLNIYEIPLIVMDVTLIEPQYLSLNTKQSINEAIKLIKIVRKYNGVFTLLWHNSSFGDLYKNDCNKIFKKIMKEIYYSKGIGLSGREIIKKFNL
ncbi:polysaccharide deacetylase family protein [Clostridium combesii]|uniref:DUF7033 domain-containing protein n=1 Tax=Clostridium combesii TaxID=39481 RepID=A0A2G7HF54_9CLOT|nr:polysaccharide deacetylase family protein [Clostridium combesii]PIH03751.1 hypothetical protein CS538_12210 [Clostridium combesii]